MNTQNTLFRRGLALVLIGISLGASSCTSPDQYRRAMDERDAEISRLREERAQWTGDRQRLQSEVKSMGLQLREASLRAKVAARPVEAAAQPGLADLGVGYAYRDGVAVITIPSKISFGSGKAALSASGERALTEVAEVLRRVHPGATYSIEGHTDSDPISKSKFASNRDLSLQRATAVLTYLVEFCDVLDDNCVVVGHGQYRPIDASNTAEGKARNRRVEIVVYGASKSG